MRIPSFQKTRMLTPTAGERLTGHPAVVILCFLLVMHLSEMGKALFDRGGWAYLHSLLTTHRAFLLLLDLFATIVTVGFVLAYCLILEKRSLTSLGFSKRGWAAEYGWGLLGGVVLFSLPVLLCLTTGTLTLSPAAASPSWEMLLLFFVAFLIQGLSEELLCRSYLMVSLSRSLPLWLCVVLNALIFSLLHLANTHLTAIALINIFLFGIFASLLTLRRGSIWMVAGLHSMWNFAQANLFGLPVSGIKGLPSPLIAERIDGGWKNLIRGGAFGLEGGLAVTVVLTVACGVVLFMPTKKSEISGDH